MNTQELKQWLTDLATQNGVVRRQAATSPQAADMRSNSSRAEEMLERELNDAESALAAMVGKQYQSLSDVRTSMYAFLAKAQ